MRRTKAEAQQTREALITAAIEVFLERGVARATLEEIAHAAGVTRGAVYWHFRDKLEIFLALEDRASLRTAQISAALESCLAADPKLDPLQELIATIRRALEALEQDAERRKLLTILWLRCEYVEEMLPALRRMQLHDAALQEHILAIIKLAALHGRLVPAWSPAMAARSLFLLLNGSVENWLRAPEEVQLVNGTMPLLEAFRDAIAVPAASPANPPAQRRSRTVRQGRRFGG
jgi:AcrR family transcriptional regulator